VVSAEWNVLYKNAKFRAFVRFFVQYALHVFVSLCYSGIHVTPAVIQNSARTLYRPRPCERRSRRWRWSAVVWSFVRRLRPSHDRRPPVAALRTCVGRCRTRRRMLAGRLVVLRHVEPSERGRSVDDELTLVTTSNFQLPGLGFLILLSFIHFLALLLLLFLVFMFTSDPSGELSGLGLIAACPLVQRVCPEQFPGSISGQCRRPATYELRHLRPGSGVGSTRLTEGPHGQRRRTSSTGTKLERFDWTKSPRPVVIGSKTMCRSRTMTQPTATYLHTTNRPTCHVHLLYRYKRSWNEAENHTTSTLIYPDCT